MVGEARVKSGWGGEALLTWSMDSGGEGRCTLVKFSSPDAE